jgi:RNA polymerase sigma-54 factor
MGKIMDQRPFLNLTPRTNLSMNFALAEAIEILQMTKLELSDYLSEEIEKNPLLELKSKSSRARFEGEIAFRPTLHEHLLQQIRENFSDPLEKLLAIELLEHLDEKGFVTCPITAPFEKVLKVLQTFDPPGIFARNLQEALLIQLKEHPLCHKLVETCFEDLLQGRLSLIKKKLKVDHLDLSKLRTLNTRPADSYRQEPISPIYPDMKITKTDTGWSLELLDEDVPEIQIQKEYSEIQGESKEERELLSAFKTKAQHLHRALHRRKKLLLALGRILICKQAPFLNQKGPLKRLTAQELALELEVHESTLSRALSGKYAITPRGILPLKAFLSRKLSSQDPKEMLKSLIADEDPKSPLTDEAIGQALLKKGVQIARRTIAKYRKELRIAPAAQRKAFRPQTISDRDGETKSP